MQKISRKLIFGFIAGIIITGGIIGLVWQYRFYTKYSKYTPMELERNSNHPDGVGIILNLEQRNLLYEAARINSADNEYLNLSLVDNIENKQIKIG